MLSDDVFAMFLESRLALGCTTKTIAWYKYVVRHFVKWLADKRYTYDSVKLIHLQQYLAYLRESYSPNSVRQTATALITFYRWCMLVELIAVDPTIGLKRPKVPDVIQPVAARSYVQHMLDKIKLYTWLDYRDRLIILILFCTGLRISECAGLRVQDVNLDERRLAIIGKGGKLRYQPFPSELVEPMNEWIKKWRPPIPNVEWMFFSATPRGTVRGPITKQAIYDTMRRRAEEAALDWIPPHGYRRGFAKDMLKHGASTRLIQKLLGHASIQTTEKYLDLSTDETHEMYDDLWEEL